MVPSPLQRALRGLAQLHLVAGLFMAFLPLLWLEIRTGATKLNSFQSFNLYLTAAELWGVGLTLFLVSRSSVSERGRKGYAWIMIITHIASLVNFKWRAVPPLVDYYSTMVFVLCAALALVGLIFSNGSSPPPKGSSSALKWTLFIFGFLEFTLSAVCFLYPSEMLPKLFEGQTVDFGAPLGYLMYCDWLVFLVSLRFVCMYSGFSNDIRLQRIAALTVIFATGSTAIVGYVVPVNNEPSWGTIFGQLFVVGLLIVELVFTRSVGQDQGSKTDKKQ